MYCNRLLQTSQCCSLTSKAYKVLIENTEPGNQRINVVQAVLSAEAQNPDKLSIQAHVFYCE